MLRLRLRNQFFRNGFEHDLRRIVLLVALNRQLAKLIPPAVIAQSIERLAAVLIVQTRHPYIVVKIRIGNLQPLRADHERLARLPFRRRLRQPMVILEHDVALASAAFEEMDEGARRLVCRPQRRPFVRHLYFIAAQIFEILDTHTGHRRPFLQIRHVERRASIHKQIFIIFRVIGEHARPRFEGGTNFGAIFPTVHHDAPLRDHDATTVLRERPRLRPPVHKNNCPVVIRNHLPFRAFQRHRHGGGNQFSADFILDGLHIRVTIKSLRGMHQMMLADGPRRIEALRA